MSKKFKVIKCYLLNFQGFMNLGLILYDIKEISRSKRIINPTPTIFPIHISIRIPFGSGLLFSSIHGFVLLSNFNG